MTTTEMPITSPPADAGQPRQGSFVERAAACAPILRRHADDYDRDGTWVHESFEHIRAEGLLAVGVPTELGGDGATISEVAAVQRELAKSCGATALASAMHQHVTAFTAWRYRRNLPGAEATLRRIAEDGIVVVSTGGGDYTHPVAPHGRSTGATASTAASRSSARRPPARCCRRCSSTTTPTVGPGC